MMKEQYLGDVSDYRKYALLRALSANSGLRLGICWMLTPDDGRNDGNKLRYLAEPDKWRPNDPPVFDLLKRVVAKPESRRLAAIEHSGILGATSFFDARLTDDRATRAMFMAAANRRLAHCDLVFFDPDNGLQVRSVAKGQRHSSKYLYHDEAREFWAGGASLLIYQHYTRERRSSNHSRIAQLVAGELPDAHTYLFAAGDVLFILAAQPHHASHFADAAARIVASWPGWFVELRPAPCGEQQESAVTSVNAVTHRPGASAHEDFCEARAPRGEWTRIGIAEAIERRGTIEMRCVDCHGRVRAHRGASDSRFRAHFEHAQRHDGCSRSPRFSGSRLRHPVPID